MEPDSPPPPELHGRGAERAALERLLHEVRAGRSAVLVLRGEAGIGKTALLDHVARHASGCRVERAAGVESEMELAFAGLHQLCGRMLPGLDRLPPPQRDALRTAFGLSAGPPPDRFLVALAALTLLSELAGDRPLVCLVDDAQWLDRTSAQALAFVARRMLAEPVALVFAVRDDDPGDVLTGLPMLAVGGIPDEAARDLLAAALHGPLDARVREQLIAECRGNPLALLELSRGLEPAGVAGGFGLPEVGPVASRVEQSFARRLHDLPPDTRRLLLAAAAEPLGDVTLLWRAAERLGIAMEAAHGAQAAGLIELGARVRFFHPLVRSAVYRSAPLEERRAVHRALAEATDPDVDPDRRAWHAAQAAARPDEAVAGELERSAERARARGGVGAAAAFLERASALSPDPERRGARALVAAHAKLEAADGAAASALLAVAQASPLGELDRARLALLRAEIAFTRRRGSEDPPLLLEAAERLVPLDPRQARATYLEAFSAAIFAGRLSSVAVVRVAEAARAAPPAADPPRTVDLLLDALTQRFTRGPAGSALDLKHALDQLRADADDPRWLWLACSLAAELWDDAVWDELAERGVAAARAAGALTFLPMALMYRTGLQVMSGDFAGASASLAENEAIHDVTGNAPLRYPTLILAAWRGDERRATSTIAAGIEEATSRGEGRAVALAEYATAVLHNGLGQHAQALAAAERACAHDDLGFCGWSLSELVEAAVGDGRRAVAEAALARLVERTSAAGTDWALGIEARSRALLATGPEAEALHRESVERFARTRVVVQHARSHLLHGEWLLAAGRRRDARDALRTAHETFDGLGAELFAARAARGLVAAGATPRERHADAAEALTAQEAKIAQLAADGHSNPEIGAQLFISPRTVEYHLRKVFGKLGVRSRGDLPQALRDPARAPVSA